MNSGITSVVRPAIGPAIRSAFDGGFAPSLLSQSMALVRKYGGALYDPSNRASLFQDSAGKIPVTAAGQPVGLMLDCQYGLQRGAELIVNGDFSAGSTGWDLFNGAAVASSGLSLPGASAFADSAGTVCTAGKWYQVEFDFLSGAGSQHINIYAGGPAFGVVVDTTPRRYKLIKLAVTSEALRVQQDGGVSGSAVLDNISCKEIPGNHAFQATTPARPTYQLVDGYPAIVVDGVDDKLFADSLSSFLDNTNSWYFSLAAKVTGGADYPIMLQQVRSVSPITRVTCMQSKVAGFAGLERFVAGTSSGGSGYAALLPLLNTSRVASYGFSQSLSTARWNNTTGVSESGSFASIGTTAAPVVLFPFGGNVYGSAFVAATPTPAEQLILTRFLASRSGVTL